MGRHPAGSGQELGGLGCPTLFDALHSFVLQSSEWQQLKQIGNAVPPMLGRIPVSAIRTALQMAAYPELTVHKKQTSFLDALV